MEQKEGIKGKMDGKEEHVTSFSTLSHEFLSCIQTAFFRPNQGMKDPDENEKSLRDFKASDRRREVIERTCKSEAQGQRNETRQETVTSVSLQ